MPINLLRPTILGGFEFLRAIKRTISLFCSIPSTGRKALFGPYSIQAMSKRMSPSNNEF